MPYQPELPEWLYAAFETRDYTDMSVCCNWAHAMFEGGDGLTVEVVVIEREGSKPAFRVLAIDQRDEAPLLPGAEEAIAGSANPRYARVLAAIAAENAKPFERYLTNMVSSPDALIALLAAFEKELNQ